MNEANHEVIKNNSLVEELSPQQLEHLFHAGEVLHVAADEILILQGQESNNFFLLLDGELEVFHPDGPERFTLAICKPGEYVGEYAFMDSVPASASVKATRPSKLFKIAHDAVRGVFKIDPDIGRVLYRNILANLVTRLRKMDKEFDQFVLIF
jgi:CRP-like cAMP-binding protein